VSGSEENAVSGAPGSGRAAGSDTETPDEVAGNAEGSEPTAADEAPGAAAGAAQAEAGQAEPAQAESAQAEPTQAGAAQAGAARDEPAQDGASGPDGSSGSDLPPRKKRKRSFWRELPILVAIALLLAVVIKTFFIQAFWIPSGSMENTLLINDRVLVNKVIYHIRGIHRGDIVVFNGDGSWDPGTVPTNGNIFQQFADGFASMFGFGTPGDILIKRVIGLPGDHVACCDADGRVTVNGVPLNEQSYLYPGSAPSVSGFNITVPSGRLWVMGDNRPLSDDSRLHQGDPGGGTIPESAVIGRAFIIIWPASRWSFLSIPATFEQPKLNAAAAGAARPDPLPTRIEPASPAVPLALGFAVAAPLTWLQRRVRMRAGRRPVSWRRLAVRARARPPAR
jgi:signal peptidase I